MPVLEGEATPQGEVAAVVEERPLARGPGTLGVPGELQHVGEPLLDPRAPRPDGPERLEPRHRAGAVPCRHARRGEGEGRARPPRAGRRRPGPGRPPTRRGRRGGAGDRRAAPFRPGTRPRPGRARPRPRRPAGARRGPARARGRGSRRRRRSPRRRGPPPPRGGRGPRRAAPGRARGSPRARERARPGRREAAPPRRARPPRRGGRRGAGATRARSARRRGLDRGRAPRAARPPRAPARPARRGWGSPATTRPRATRTAAERGSAASASARSAFAPSRSNPAASPPARRAAAAGPTSGARAAARARAPATGAPTTGRGAAGGGAPGRGGRRGEIGRRAVLAGEGEVERRALAGARDLHDDAVDAGLEGDRDVDDAREPRLEVAPLVDERAVHRHAGGHRRPEGDEVTPAARQGDVRREDEDVPSHRLALDGGRAVRRGERPGRPRRAAEGGGHRLGEDAGLRRPGGDEVEGAAAAERPGQGPGLHRAVLAAHRGDLRVVPEDLGGDHAGHPRPVGGEAAEPTGGEGRREAGLDGAGDLRRLVGELREAPERDEGEGVARRGLGEQRRARPPRSAASDARRARSAAARRSRGSAEALATSGAWPCHHGVEGAAAGGAMRGRRAARDGKEEGAEGAAHEPGRHLASPAATGAGASRTRRAKARSSEAMRVRNAG